MKQIYILLLIGFVSCVHRQDIHLDPGTEHKQSDAIVSGKLSDIASQIVAIPLETNTQCLLTSTDQIRRDGENLFILSNHQLYHFNRKGEFLNQLISKGKESIPFAIHDYVIDPVRKQLIVLDKKQTIHYYTYNGDLLYRKKLAENIPWQKIIKLSYFDKHIWATTENLEASAQDISVKVYEKWLYKLDTSFTIISGVRLQNADLGRFYINGNFSPELYVTNNKVYVHSPSLQGNQLLRDSLYLISNNQLEPQYPIRILPIRIHRRFLISSYQNSCTQKQNYLFCYDQTERKSFNIKEGFQDNFYQTGQVYDLQTLDVYNEELWYCKSSKDVQRSFPERKVNDNPVVFIVKLKG